MRSLVIFAIATVVIGAALSSAATPKTFCNPIDIDYALRPGKQPWRHGADPVIVLYCDRYWLFSTWDRPGYRVSDDLIHWTFVPFKGELADKAYTAAAVAEIDGQLYFTELGTKAKPSSLFHTTDPASGVWEKVRDLPSYADPCLFVDPPSGHVFMYHGLNAPIRGVELDRKTFAEIPGTETQLMPALDRAAKIEHGWEVCTADNNEASPGGRGDKTFRPCREGSWMTFHDGKYFLQYASPGTTVAGYADGVLIGDSPLGPFTYSQHSPISAKRSGFITSAGHSCLFQDRYKNWWRATTMLVGVHNRFERRIGLFPAGFDRDNIPYTRTEIGDEPITIPDGPRDQAGDVSPGWWNLADGKRVRASSALEDHPPTAANDDEVRTWWSAKTGNAGEWLEIDLGHAATIHALQINFAEQDCNVAADLSSPGRFLVFASDDGQNWKQCLDHSAAKFTSPHTYAAFNPPLSARFIRVANAAAAAGGKFAVRDVRAFGVADLQAPKAVAETTVERDTGDRRKAIVRWRESSGASAYLIRFGLDASHLNQHHLIRGGKMTSFTTYSLNAAAGYVFRVDALNDAGLTAAQSVVDAR